MKLFISADIEAVPEQPSIMKPTKTNRLTRNTQSR